MKLQKFSDYLEFGFSVMPCRGKNPLLSWKKYQKEKPLKESVLEWDKTNHNIAIITGKVSNLVIVDIDGEYPKDLPKMPKTWAVKTAKGYHYYFEYPDFEIGNRTNIFNAKEGETKIDIRGEGGYVIAPPSKHETGVHYEWVNSPDTCVVEKLPDFWVEYLKPKKTERTVAPPSNYKIDAENEEYIQAAIDGEVNYLQNALEGTRNDQLNRSAFALAQILPKSKVESILKPIALSIGLTAKEVEKTLKSALGSAKPREIPQKNIPIEAPLGDCPLVKSIIEKHGKKIHHTEISSDLVDNAPGMLGGLIRWILETSIYPQPVLALASAIPTIGNVMAHRVSTETNLRTNFFTLGIAESGAGKEHARRCISKLYEYTGLTDTILGDPSSAPAVINSVKRNGGRGIMLIDEFGRFLEAVNGKNAASHAKQITTNMMLMFNAAGDIFTGNEYANNDAAGGRSDIDQPCLGIYATTVAGRFYNSLTKEEAFDGFLARWLVFETNRFDIEPSTFLPLGEPPTDLKEELIWWNQKPTFYGGSGNIAQYTTIKPRIIKFKDSVRQDWFNYMKDCRRKMAKSSNPIERAFYNRAGEHCAKLALVAHTGQEIDSNTFEWAKLLTDSLTESMINNISQNVTENNYEDSLKKIKDIIKNCGESGASLSDLAKKARFCNRKARQDFLDTLVEAGDIYQEIEPIQEGSGKPRTKYFIS